MPIPGDDSGQADFRSIRAAFFRVFAGISLPMTMSIADSPMIATALPSITAEIGGADRMTLIIICYLVASMVSAPLYGRLGDAFGLRRLMFVSLAVFVTGALLCGAAGSLALLALFRAVQGFGAGGLLVLAQAILSDVIPARQRGQFQGYLGVIVVASQGFGPVVGGFVTAAFGWQAVFLIQLPLGLLAVLLLLRLPVRFVEARAFRFDFVGTALLSAALSATMASLFAIQSIAHVEPVRLMATALAAVAFTAAFLWHEARIPHPLFPPDLLALPAIRRADLVAMGFGALLVPCLIFIPILFRVRYGLGTTELGFAILPFSIGLVFGSTLTGWLVTRTGRTTAWGMFGLSGIMAIMVVLALLPELPLPLLRVMFGLAGILSGTVMGPVQVIIAFAARREQLGSASASVQFARMLGSALGTALLSTVMFVTLRWHGPEAVAEFERLLIGQYHQQVPGVAIDRAFAAVFAVLALTAMAACLCLARVPVKRV